LDEVNIVKVQSEGVFERPFRSFKFFQPSLTTQQNLVAQPPLNALKPPFMTIDHPGISDEIVAVAQNVFAAITAKP